MRTSCVKNGLVVGVILLFIGIAVQPSIAVNPISSNNEDNCDICPKVSNLDRITILKKINKEYVSGLSWNFPISCGILFMIAFFISIIANVFYNLPRQPWKVLTTLAAFFLSYRNVRSYDRMLGIFIEPF